MNACIEEVARDLTQVQQITNDGDQEAVLLLFLHADTDGTDGPAQRVQRTPCPLASQLQSEVHSAEGGQYAQVNAWLEEAG